MTASLVTQTDFMADILRVGREHTPFIDIDLNSLLTAVEWVVIKGYPLDALDNFGPAQIMYVRLVGLDFGTDTGNKIPVIKALREVVKGMGLKEAKDAVEEADRAGGMLSTVAIMDYQVPALIRAMSQIGVGVMAMSKTAYDLEVK